MSGNSGKVLGAPKEDVVSGNQDDGREELDISPDSVLSVMKQQLSNADDSDLDYDSDSLETPQPPQTPKNAKLGPLDTTDIVIDSDASLVTP